ncbi:DUF7344 domain-containing protein [Halobacteriaceae archaeon SHR40]|uniref:DUF7344 domain-containing protein n=1 Tax=Halovenus amylolytica TaxID=2500550 RepID=UPI000FE43CB1
MPSTDTPGRPSRTEQSLPVTTIFRLLSSERRLCALRYLSQSVGAVDVEDLADHLALHEGEHTREHFERICTSLVHVHIPPLVEAGVVEYDPDRETLTLCALGDQFGPYLELADRAES